MSTYYYVSAAFKQVANEYEDPYGRAVLNSIKYETDVVGNLIIASANRPFLFLSKVYKEAYKYETTSVLGFPYGLPDVEFVEGFIPNIVSLKLQIVADTQTINNTSMIWGLKVNVTTGENISTMDVAKAWVCNEPLFNGNPIGLNFTYGENTIDYVHHENPISDPRDPDNRIIHRLTPKTYTDPWLYGELVEVHDPSWFHKLGTDDTLDELNQIGNTTYNYYKFYYGVGKAVNTQYTDSAGDQIHEWYTDYDGPRDQNSIGFFPKPAPKDVVYTFSWFHPDYINEEIFGIYNVTAVDYSSWGLLPTDPVTVGPTYPVIQFRKDKLWLDAYETSLNATHIRDTFKKFKMGTIDDFISSVSQSPNIDDISDMFFVWALDAYSDKNIDNKYMYMFWLFIRERGGPVIKQSNDLYALNFVGVLEGDYQQYITFRRVQSWVSSSGPIDPTDTSLVYSHRWETINNDGVTEVVAPWAGGYVDTGTGNEDESLIYVPPDDDAFSRKFKRIEKLSMRVLIIEVHNEDGALLAAIEVNGLQQEHHIYFPDSDRNMWTENMANPDDEVNVNAQALAEYNEEEYTGDNGTPFPIPLLHDLMTTQYFTDKDLNHITARSLFLQMYATKKQYVSWWQEALSFVLEAFQLFNVVLTIITLGLNLIASASLEAVLHLVYTMALNWAKGQLVKIFVTEVAKLIGTGNTALLMFLVDAYNGEFDDIAKLGMKGLEKLLDLVMAVSEISMSYQMDKLTEDYANMSDKDQEKLEELVSDQEQKTGEPVGEDDKFKAYEDVILLENPTEFLTRTTAINAADQVARNVLNYGSTPGTKPKYAYTETEEGSEKGEIDVEFFMNFDD